MAQEFHKAWFGFEGLEGGDFVIGEEICEGGDGVLDFVKVGDKVALAAHCLRNGVLELWGGGVMGEGMGCVGDGGIGNESRGR